MNDLIELSHDEMLSIEGGDWVKDFGAWCHETWCDVKDYLYKEAQRLTYSCC